MNSYVLYWMAGDYEIVHGETIKQAMTLEGYGAGAVRALDFYEKNDRPTYSWNSETRNWEELNWRVEMKLIANVELSTEIPIHAGQEIEFEFVDDYAYESKKFHYLAKDPVIDGLIRFRHPDAPWGEFAESVAKELHTNWMSLLKDWHDGAIEIQPAEGMVGTTFQVFCWKAFDELQAGEVYEAVIEDCFGMDTDGFVIHYHDREILVEMVYTAINHFVLV